MTRARVAVLLAVAATAWGCKVFGLGPCLAGRSLERFNGAGIYLACVDLPTAGHCACEDADDAEWLIEQQYEALLVGEEVHDGYCYWVVDVEQGPDPCRDDACCYRVEIDEYCDYE
jgi:hypothetical protein